MRRALITRLLSKAGMAVVPGYMIKRVGKKNATAGYTAVAIRLSRLRLTIPSCESGSFSSR